MALKDEQATLSGAGRIYMKVDVTDLTHGALTFYFGDSAFVATNVAGGPQVYSCVTEWGSMRKFLSVDGRKRESDMLLDFDANAIVVPSNSSTLRWTFSELLNEVNLRDAVVEVWQYNTRSTEQAKIWAGYWDSIKDYRLQDRYPIITVRIKPRVITQETPIGTIVTLEGFPDAPHESVGKMFSHAYGDGRVRLTSGGSFQYPFLLGYPIPGVPGAAYARADSSGRIALQVRFSENDGTSTATEFKEGTNDIPGAESSVYFYDPVAGLPCMINPVEIVSATNTADECDAEIQTLATAFMPVRLADATTNNTIPNPFKLQDDDPANFSDSTDSLFVLEMDMPSLPLMGNALSVQLVVDVENTAAATRSYTFGFRNPHTGATIGTDSTGSLSSLQARTLLFTGSLGGTNTDFTTGKFVTRDGAGVEKPTRARFELNGGAGNRTGVRFRGFSFIIKMQVPLVVRGPNIFSDPNYVSFITPGLLELLLRQGRVKGREYRLSNDLKFFGVGAWQKDDGSGTFTGSAAANIGMLPDIIRHMIVEAGESINTTAGTIGNSVDARDVTTGLGGYDDLLISFGETPIKLKDALTRIESEFGTRVEQEDNVWNIIPETANPHESRFYRNTSDVVTIESYDLIDIRVWEDEPDDFQNSVVVQYGLGFGSGRPQGSESKKNNKSILYFGERDPEIISAPSCVQQVIGAGAAPLSATTLASYRSQRAAWPRLNVVATLSQKFYDVKRGHILMFGSTMDTTGMPCPAYRCGRMDYQHFRSDSGPGANQANDTTPTFTAATTSETYFLASYQFPWLDVAVSGVGTYTEVNNGWEYYNGSSWVAFSNVTRSDGGDPDAVFKAASGTYRIAWDMPDPWEWRKVELTLVSTVIGPGYPARMKYTSAGSSITGTDLVRSAVTWTGRQYEVIEVTRRPGGADDYPGVEVVMKEVM